MLSEVHSEEEEGGWKEMEADLSVGVKLVASLVLGGFVILFVYLYREFVVKPQRLRSRLEKQGIRGPSPSFFLGNIPEIKRIKSNQPPRTQEKDHLVISHDWPHTLFSYLYHWMDEYGPTFMYSTGNLQLLFALDTDMVKEVLLSTSFTLGKPDYVLKHYGPILGNSVFSSNGAVWAHHRKIIAPEFYPEKVKSLMSLIVDSTTSMIRSWESRIESGGGMAEIDAQPDLRSLSADIIARACFGSNYVQGEQIFLKIRTLQNLLSEGYVGIPGLRYLPTKKKREIWRLEKEVNSMILKVVKQRTEANYEEDLLQMILEAAKANHDGDPSSAYLDKFVVGNCKALYFAGNDTTATAASWSLVLLAAYPEWQTRARAEVLDICKDKLPDADMLRNMKTITMVIQETLRLYSPAVFATRYVQEDFKYKDMILPKGILVQMPIGMLHQDTNLWGADAHKFNPDRFANGVLGACKSPQAYIPFGTGPRFCLGQHLAMAELKVMLSLILSKFSFSLSPSYVHSPTFKMVMQPEHGVILHIRRL